MSNKLCQNTLLELQMDYHLCSQTMFSLNPKCFDKKLFTDGDELEL